MIIRIVILGLIVLIITLFTFSKLNFTKRGYYKLINQNNELLPSASEIITEDDLKNLPIQIQNYLNYVGVVGSEKVKSFQVTMSGEMKIDEKKEFAPVNVLQTSYINPTTRLFYMDMKYNGIKISGLHHYENYEASMKIKILDILTIINESSDIGNQAETVTVFNDMFLLAPGSLIDDRITWNEIDEYTVEATFTNGEISVSAKVFFDEEGKFINFISEDRYFITNNMTLKVPWSTPITEYREINGLNLPYKGSAIWHFEDHDFEYIKLIIEDVVINP